MLPFRLVYSEEYYLPIGAHVFPAEKYRLIHKRLLETGVAEASDFVKPCPAADEDIRLVHTAEYVNKLQSGTLSLLEEQWMEVPYSPELVKTFWLSAGGSILAAQLALEDGMSFNIAGGFHHAHPDHGEGFCMIHDVAIAIRRMQKDKKIKRALTLDCDVHHGNGTAAIFPPRRHSAPLPSTGAVLARRTKPDTEMLAQPAASREEVFTISLHQENNYPAYKPPSSIDVNLPDGTSDELYLSWLDNALSSGLRQFTPELICYLAGADPYREDQLGGLALTKQGLKARDALVFKVTKSRGIPVMVTYAGGYARNVQDTVTIHCNTVVAAAECFARRQTE